MIFEHRAGISEHCWVETPNPKYISSFPLIELMLIFSTGPRISEAWGESSLPASWTLSFIYFFYMENHTFLYNFPTVLNYHILGKRNVYSLFSISWRYLKNLTNSMTIKTLKLLHLQIAQWLHPWDPRNEGCSCRHQHDIRVGTARYILWLGCQSFRQWYAPSLKYSMK